MSIKYYKEVTDIDGSWIKPAPEVAEKIESLKAEIERLRGLVLMGDAVVEDFLPNIGNCCLQDYGRLNEFLIATTALKAQEQG